MRNRTHTIRHAAATAAGKLRAGWGAQRLAVTAALLGGIGFAATPAAAQTTLLVTDEDGNKVVRYDYPSGQVFDHFVGNGVSPLDVSSGMVLTPDGDVLVGSRGNDSVQLYSGQTGRFIRTFITSGSGGLSNTHMMTYGHDGHLYVASPGSNQVSKYDGVTGVFLGIAATGVDARDIVFGPDSTMFVSGEAGDRVAMFDPTDGTYLGDIDTSSTGLDGPFGMALDSVGNIYVTSFYTDSVIRIDIDTLEASYFIFPGVGSLDGPTDLAFDEDGNLLVASWLNGNVLKYDQFGNFDSVVISTATDGGLNGTWGLLLYTPSDTCRADFNEDGTVNTQDFVSFLNAWIAGCP